MDNKLELNKYNFYELVQKPSPDELKEYYSKKYYQQNKGSYEQEYTDEERTYFKNKIEQRYWVLNKFIDINSIEKSLLDIGCGEGFALDFFGSKNWEVLGVDYSEYGCKKFNPHHLPDLLTGDIYQQILLLIETNKKFDVIWLDNVLEHVLDPLELLKKCKSLLNKDGILIVEVPNDFSVLQKYLLSNKHIDTEFWVAIPDHISYFNSEGLTAIAAQAELKNIFVMGDYPIDFNLINPDTNYTRDKTKGKNVHKSRVGIDNLMHAISVEKTVNYYKALADLGLGRQIVSFFKHV